MIYYEFMKEPSLFWFARDMMQYEMNPNMIFFMMDEEWQMDLWGKMETYGSDDSQ